MRATHLFAHDITVTTLLCYHELERAVSDLTLETLTRLQLVCDVLDRHCCSGARFPECRRVAKGRTPTVWIEKPFLFEGASAT